MPKQTVEEAATVFSKEKLYVGGQSLEIEDPKLYNGFIGGVEWKSAQGIDWIKVEDQLPPQKQLTDLCIYSIRVLVTDGESIEINEAAINKKDGQLIGWMDEYV